MTTFVVDTNVLVAANGDPDKNGERPDPECERKCVRRLRQIVDTGTVAIDYQYAICREYGRHVGDRSQRGREPKPGDVFFKQVVGRRCRVLEVSASPGEDESWGIEALRESSFDPSDRKFLAVAVAANGVVINATDNDWHESQGLMERLGLEVEEVCPHVLRCRG